MADCCNSPVLSFLCPTTKGLLVIIAACAVLLLSLCLNIYFCISSCCSGKWIHQSRKKQRSSSRQMEENPIYGNLGYTQTSTAVFTNTDHLQRVDSDVQSKTQDCYANLTLKPPRQQSGHSSSQALFSEEVLSEEPLEEEEKEEPSTDAVSTLSDLYASVQTQRTKTVHPAASGEEYANHL